MNHRTTPRARAPYAATLCAALSLAAITSACGPSNTPDAGSDIVPGDAAADDVPVDTAPPGPVHQPADCDPLDETECSFPWPSNLYLAPDTARATGVTLTFGRTTLPDNRMGRTIDPTPYRRLDGYSVGTPIMTVFPNADIATMATEDHIERSLLPDARALLFAVNGTTLTRVPYWVELDHHETDAAVRTLFLRPAVILEEGTRYIVAFRDMRNMAGAVIAPGEAFAALRAGNAASHATLGARLGPRQAHFNEVFTLLESQGVMRDTLTLAWDFNTASSAALHGPLLYMVQDALAATGPMGPVLTVTGTTEYTRTADGSGREVNENIALEIRGTMSVPHYMKPLSRGFNGWQFNLDAMGRPLRNGDREAPFWVRVPYSALGGAPHGLMEYGHGLLGEGDEVRAGYNGRIANGTNAAGAQNNLILFSGNLVGMSSDDGARVPTMVQDLTYFVWMGDRLHQGILEFVLLARAMRERLGSLPEITSRNIRINRDELFYSGISQGGIFGATVVAVSPDLSRGHLGVPGNNYSTLLHRSVDFTRFFDIMRNYYSRASNQSAVLATIQLLWDQTEPVSYYRHLSAAPFPGQTANHVLLAPAKGDHQVSVLTNEVVARTTALEIPLMANYDRERTPFGATQVPYGAMPGMGHMGSGIVLYDFGNPWPPLGNQVPTDTMEDPHGRPRAQLYHDRQLVHFLRTGEIIDVCGGDGCRPD